MIESPPRFFVRRYEPSDDQFVLDLMRASLGESPTLRRSEDVWHWKHIANWFGPSHVLVATSQLKPIVGLRAFMRWRFRLAGELFTAVRAVDTATHPDFQRRGMFSQLTSRAVHEVRADGTEIIFNTPNEKSKPGYLKLGWSEVGSIQPLIKILNHRHFATGMMRHKLGRGGGSDGVDQEDFFRSSRPDHVGRLLDHPGVEALISANEDRWRDFIRTDTGKPYLAWRYASHPLFQYFATHVETNGTLRAAAIFRLNRRFGLREIVLSELLLGEDDPGLVRDLVQQIREQIDGDYLIGYAGEFTPDAGPLAGAGFRRFPIAAMSLTANPLSSRVTDWRELQRWGMSIGDLEYF